MIRLLSIVILTAFLTHTFSRLIILVHHRVNKEYIVANLCENKDKPASHCEGKCHLKKQIDREEKSEKNPVAQLKGIEVQLFSKTAVLFSFFPRVGTEVRFAPCDAGQVRSAIVSVFHPPSV
jgi:hypothetical protein